MRFPEEFTRRSFLTSLAAAGAAAAFRPAGAGAYPYPGPILTRPIP